MTTQAFWIPEGNNIFRATIHTQGPWNPQFQHGGPPAALLVRQMEQCSPRPDMLLARISIDILGPIPIASLHAHARVIRPGRSVELLEASLENAGRPVMQARGWRIRISPDSPTMTEPSHPGTVVSQETNHTTAPEWRCGFLAATEWRFVQGDFARPGAAVAWTRLRYPLIADEMPTPIQRLVAAADSSNGISSPLDIRSWQFIPPELTVHSLRLPIGEWICLNANTLLQSEGTGLTTANLYDEHGLVGRSAQALLISRRTQEK